MFDDEIDDTTDPLLAFIYDANEADVLQHWDPATDSLVTTCPACGATASHTRSELPRFQIHHEPWCRPEWRVGTARPLKNDC
jgi:hypothetical protein